MTSYSSAFKITGHGIEENENQNEDKPIKITPREGNSSMENNKKYIMSEIITQENQKKSPTGVESKFEDIDLYLKSIFKDDAKVKSLLHIPLPKNRKTREAHMTPFINYTLPSRLAQISQPEQLRTKWIIIFSICYLFLLILFLINVSFYSDSVYITTFFLATFFYTITVIALLAQRRRKKLFKPLFPEYNSNFFDITSSSDSIDSPSAMFAKAPTTSKTDSNFNSSYNISRPYIFSDRATADINKDQREKLHDYDQLNAQALKTLGISSLFFNKYLTNWKSFIQKNILSKLVKKIHTNDSLYISMLSVPGYERYTNYIKSRITSLASSHVLAGHFGDKGASWDDREWTTDFPSDNEIILHILDVWFSYFMGGKRKESNNSMFKQKYVFIKKDHGNENEDSIFLCSDDWAHFYVYTMLEKGKRFQKFFAPAGRDSMYGGLVLFFWFIKEKKNYLIEGADLKEEVIGIDRIYSDEYNQID